MAAENPFDCLQAAIREYASIAPSYIQFANASRCFESSKYSDATIHCGDQKFKVHKIVLCAQSKYFSKIFDGDWKVIELKHKIT